MCAAVTFIFSEMAESPSTAMPAPDPDLYGIDRSEFSSTSYTIRSGETIFSTFREHGVDRQRIYEAVQVAEPVFDVRSIKAGNELLVYNEIESGDSKLFIYLTDNTNFFVFDLSGDVSVYHGEIHVNSVRKVEHGVIARNSSIQAVLEDRQVARKLESIFSPQIDFRRLNAGDYFSVVYDADSTNNIIYNQQILAAHLNVGGEDYYAYGFSPDGGDLSYYEYDGTPWGASFLLAPVNYRRISSRFNPNRFHPILKVYRPHLSTDFSADYGAPIWATAAGVVTHSAYQSGKGHFVEIRHENGYKTRYLHMSKRAVTKGQRVEQKQVIGYVGKTGLATGSHVCYRIERNGVPFDPLKELPQASPLDSAAFSEFEIWRNGLEAFLPTLPSQSLDSE